MAFPAGLTQITVQCQFDTLPSGGAAGTVTIAYDGQLTGPTDNSVVPYVDVTGVLNASGACSIVVPATNDPGWTPVDFQYDVTAKFGTATRTGKLQLDFANPTVQLSDLIQWDGSAVAGTTYATLAQLNAVSSDVATVAADVAALTASVVRASDLGLVAHSFPAAQIQGGTIVPTAGLIHVVRVRALSAVAVNVELYVTTGGTSLTSGRNFAALYADNGGLLGAGAVTADQSTAWQSTGRKSMALSVGQGITANAWYRVAFFANGSVLPTFGRAAALDSSAAGIVGGLSAPFRYSTADSGLTTTMPSNLGAQTAIGTAWWAAIS